MGDIIVRFTRIDGLLYMVLPDGNPCIRPGDGYTLEDGSVIMYETFGGSSGKNSKTGVTYLELRRVQDHTARELSLSLEKKVILLDGEREIYRIEGEV
jgi:hypothetical protein